MDTTMPMFAPTKARPWEKTTELLTTLLDASYKAKQDAQPRREYLGASMMGKDCVRAVAYEYHGVAKDPERGFSGRLYRVFDMGHDGEERMSQYLRIGGFELRTVGRDGKQFGYEVAGGKMKGHIDGVIVEGPDVGCPWPALWENKALNDKGFNDVADKGIEKAKPLYFAQVQIYMAYLALDRCLFTCINRDTGDLYAEVIELHAQKAQSLSDRGVKVIESRQPEDFPRIAREETDYRCRFCDWHDRCWSASARVPQSQTRPAPSWLNKGE
jgi:hypothetical protein